MRFAYRLAMKLGRLDVTEVTSLTLKQLEGWRAYADLEPFGEQRDDLRAAMIARTIANTMGRAAGQEPYKLDDFMLKFEGDEDESTPKKLTPSEKRLKDKMWIEYVVMAYTQPGAKDV